MKLEEAIYRIKIHKECAGLENGTCIVNIKDLETLLKELERLQEENAELKQKERNRHLGKYGENEVHNLINKTLQEDYIPKDKIRNKLEQDKENYIDAIHADNKEIEWVENMK